MAKNDLPSSTVAYITLITRVFWPFLGRVNIFIQKWWPCLFWWKFHFHQKRDGTTIFVSWRGSCLDRSFYRGASHSRKTPLMLEDEQWSKNIWLTDVWRAFLICFLTLFWGSVDPPSRGGGQKGGVGPPPKMGVEIRGFFGPQKMVKNGQKRCGTEG